MPANGHDTFPSARPPLSYTPSHLKCMFLLIQPGAGMYSRFAVTMVTFSAPQASNSSDDALCFSWGLVCQQVLPNICFILGLGLPFALCLRQYVSPHPPNYPSSTLLTLPWFVLVNPCSGLSQSRSSTVSAGLRCNLSSIPLHPSTVILGPAHILELSLNLEGFLFFSPPELQWFSPLCSGKEGKLSFTSQMLVFFPIGQIGKRIWVGPVLSHRGCCLPL